MGMFLNYHNIADNYTPNNLVSKFPVGKSYTKLDPQSASKPYEEYDVRGNLIGYFWHYKDTLKLEFNIDGEITVESDALILTHTGEAPSSSVGYIGQKAYNISDLVSWVCTAVVDNECVWSEESEFIYDEESNRHVYIDASKYLSDKFIEITLYNFRLEPIHSVTLKGNTKAVLNIDSVLSAKLVKGVYYCEVCVFNDEVRTSIFSPTDCILNVK